jgi:UDP-N-acetylglucosamine--N-acetylmuramyl-(pentapeptide) pyrophosphoryl-undecaprenol N-acetylglucosamine transferase
VVTVLIAGGGTGGHVFPMLAVGQALSRDGNDVFYVGTARGLEQKLIGDAGGDLELLDVAPLRGAGVKGAVQGGVKALASLKAARDLVKRRRPDVVLSVGGYAGGPVALAARLMGVPLAVLEPNSVLGFTNRVLGPLAHRVYVAFGEWDRRFRPGVVVRSGVPLRSAFQPSPYQPVAGRFRVLVLGGSQGAKALNEQVPPAFKALIEAVPYAEIVHQAGRSKLEPTAERYAALTGARVVEFIDDVAGELARADVVIQRCGASAVSELCIVGRASILVPFPFAADQHQLANAKSLEREGAAITLEESAAGENLARLLIELANDPARRQRMADGARALATPNAARDVADDLVALAQRRTRGRR